VLPGDLYAIPVDHLGFGVCQIIFATAVLFVVVFRDLIKRPIEHDATAVSRCEPALVGWTVDALIQTGRWPRIGKASVDLARIPLPPYRVEVEGHLMIEDTRGNRRRIAAHHEIAKVGLRKTVAPIRFQRALRALHGLEPWMPQFDELTLARVAESAKVVV